MSILDSIRALLSKPTSGGGGTIARSWPIYETQTPQYPMPHPYTLANIGYRFNEIVYACIHKRATAVAEAPLMVYAGDEDDDDREMMKDHPARLLFKRPNEAMSEGEFWQATEIYMCIAGFAAWEIELTNGGQPIALWPMRPDWCSFKRGLNRPLEFVHYQPPHTNGVDVPIEKVLMFSEFDPLNPMLLGLSKSAVAMRVISADNHTTNFVAAFFQRGAAMSGILKTAQSLSDAEATRIRQRWREVHAGQQNWHDIAVLGGGAEFQAVQSTFKDMDFSNLDGRDEARICSVFQVSPILVGVKIGLDRSTLSNFGEARVQLYEEAIQSRWKYLSDEVQTQLMARYYDDLDVEFKTDDIKALQEDRTSKFTRADTGFKSGWMTRDEARHEAGFDPIDDEPVFHRGAPAVGEEGSREFDIDMLPAGIPPVQPSPPSPRPPPGLPDEAEPDEDDLKAWRKEALDAVKSGQAIPGRDGWPKLNAALAKAKTAGDVRKAFDAHWPAKRTPVPASASLDDLVREIREARVALEGAQP